MYPIVSLCRQFAIFTVLGDLQEDWLIWSFRFANEQNVKTRVNYLSIRNRKRRRRQREINKVAIKFYKVVFFFFSFLSSLFSDFEADAACWRTTRTGFQSRMKSQTMSRDVKECLFRHDSASSPSAINTCSRFTLIESHHSLSLLQKHDLIREQFWDVTFLSFFQWRDPVHVHLGSGSPPPSGPMHMGPPPVYWP